jgi:MFS family permease
MLVVYGVWWSFPVLVTAIARFGGILADRFGREITSTIALLVSTVGIVALLLLSNSNQAWLLYGYAITFGFGLGLFAPTYSCTAADLFSGEGLWRNTWFC